jgi:PhnB protein
MHSQFQIGDTTVMASDGRCTGKANFQGIMLSISADSEAEADRLFTGLADGGQVQMPLGKTFFSPRFGMVADKFGVGWMIIVPN